MRRRSTRRHSDWTSRAEEKNVAGSACAFASEWWDCCTRETFYRYKRVSEFYYSRLRELSFFFPFFFVSFYTTYFAFSCFSFALDGREKYSFVFDVVLRWIKPHKCLIRDMGHVPCFVKFVIGMTVKMKIRRFQSSLGAPPIEISVTCQYRLTYYRDIFARNVYSKLSLTLKRYFLKQ